MCIIHKLLLDTGLPFFMSYKQLWTLPFSPSRGSVILLISLLTAFLAWTVYMVIRNEFGANLGIFAGVAFDRIATNPIL